MWKKMLQTQLFGGSALGINYWDECGKNRITRIFVVTNSKGITSIQFGYVGESDSADFSNRHGGNGNDFKVVKTDYPSEYLTSVSGCYVCNMGGERIYQLSFGTNKQKYQYGPFGCEIAIDYSSTRSSFSIEMDKDFYGFYGYSNDLGICGIGVYLKPDACVFSSSAQITSAVSDFDDDTNCSDFIKKEAY